jgi:predicted ATPase
VPAEPAAVAEGIRRTAIRYMERLIEVSGPRIVVIDDLHWLDPSSAGMVDEIVRLTSRIPLLLLIGMRAGPSPVGSSLDPVERIHLRGLDLDETRELAAAVFRRAVDPADAKRLHARTAATAVHHGDRQGRARSRAAD